MDVKDGAGKRRAHHAGLEVSWREADVDTDAEQDRHAAVEGALDGSIDRSVRGLSAGCGRRNWDQKFSIIHTFWSCVPPKIARRRPSGEATPQV